VEARNDALGQRCRTVGGPSSAIDDGELVAGDSPDAAHWGENPTETLGNGYKHVIASLVPEGVVDVLEAVNIDEQHRRSIPRLRTIESACKEFGDERTVRKSCQRVSLRLALEFPLHAGVGADGEANSRGDGCGEDDD
jgi:hypothetical protein